MYIEQMEILDKGKRKLLFEHGVELLLYQGEIKKYDLREQTEISEELYLELLYGIVGKRAKKRAMHLLERQDRTEYQLQEKLRQNGYPAEVIEEALAYVKTYHYIDDLRYACNYVRAGKEKKSRQRLCQDLMKKGVKRQIIEQALDEEGNEDETAAICDLLEKKGYRKDLPKNEIHKIYQFLLRRGYQSSDILRAMRAEYLT
ncbi:MAG: regulatory protein RecX [Lachnospiraceae bacterium]|nr:regulatory protein RecX [Lachnospiraceae bacterium]